MEALGLVVTVAVVVLAAVALFALMAPTGKARFPYKLDNPLFSPAERSFLGVLNQVVGDRYRVFGKVRLADIFSVTRTRDRRERQTAFNRISSKHFDFVLCDPSDLSVVCAIELDDRSHGSAKRAKRDRFLDQLCEQAGLSLVRFPARRGYSAADVESRLETAIGGARSDTEQTPVTEDPSAAPTPSDGGVTDRANDQPESANARSCPKCGGAMVIKTARRGENAGRQFWACSLFPKCRTAIPVDRQPEQV